MTVVRLRTPADDEDLVRRARRGDARAHRLLVRRHAPRTLELTRLTVGTRTDVSALAAQALSVALADTAPLDTALVRAVIHVTNAHLDRAALASVVILLTDVEGRSESTVADLLGRDTGEIAELRASGRDHLELPVDRNKHCRGWPLATARDRLTGAEQSAADGHLRVCRSCAARLRERDRARQRLLARSAAMTGAVAEVVALSLGMSGTALGAGGTSLAGLVSGKAAAALLGAATIAVATTSGAVAAARSQQHPQPGTVVNAPDTHRTPAARHHGTGTDQRRGHNGNVLPRHRRTTQPSPAATPTPSSVPTGPLPSIPVQVPDLPRLPTRLPLPSLSPLPTALPLPSSLRVPSLL